MIIPTSSNRPHRPHVVILGGGVIGISLALCLLDVPEQHRVDVTIVAADLPDAITQREPADSTSVSQLESATPVSYASAWAGAHHVSCPASEREAQWELNTFKVLKGMMQLNGGRVWSQAKDTKRGEQQQLLEALCWVRQVELFVTPTPRSKGEEMMRNALTMYSHYREDGGLDSAAPSSSSPFFQRSTLLPAGRAYHFHTIDFNVPVYLPLLYARFLALGGKVVRRHVNSLAKAKEAASTNMPSRWSSPRVIFATPGLGAKDLMEIRDQNVFPVRGQTLLIRAPWLRYERADGSEEAPLWPAVSRMNESGERDMYIIPRGGGDFIVGGTREVGKTDPLPSGETTRRILQRALEICPSLVSPRKRSPPGIAPKPEDVDIVGLNVGLRPSREGGAILEERGDITVQGAKVILGYGFGGYGYQRSWGAAMEGRQLIYEALGVKSLASGYTLESLEEAGVLEQLKRTKEVIPGIRRMDVGAARL